MKQTLVFVWTTICDRSSIQSSSMANSMEDLSILAKLGAKGQPWVP